MTDELLSNSHRLTTNKDHILERPNQDQDSNRERGSIKQSNYDIETDPDSGLETEKDDQEIRIERPFDPEKIKVRTTTIVVELLVSRLSHKEIDLEPDFQRLSVWNKWQRCQLIESLLLRIPIPVFYVAADEQENWAVVDGVQRMSTIYDFVKDKFSLNQLEYLSLFEGRKYSDLPRSMQRRIVETQLVVNIIDPSTPEDVMFNIFRRINTGGMTLNGQEIRNALHRGPVRQYLRTLAESEDFLDATVRSIRTTRMADRECVLRFLAFYIDQWEDYGSNDLDGYLSQAMTKINRMTSEQCDEIAKDFKKAMRAACDIFGQDSFRRRYNRNDPRRPVSKALFEAWSVRLARCSPEQINRLVDRREEVKERFITLMNQDSEFDRAISYSTGLPRRVKKRFSTIEKLVEEMM